MRKRISPKFTYLLIYLNLATTYASEKVDDASPSSAGKYASAYATTYRETSIRNHIHLQVNMQIHVHTCMQLAIHQTNNL